MMEIKEVQKTVEAITDELFEELKDNTVEDREEALRFYIQSLIELYLAQREQIKTLKDSNKFLREHNEGFIERIEHLIQIIEEQDETIRLKEEENERLKKELNRLKSDLS